MILFEGQKVFSQEIILLSTEVMPLFSHLSSMFSFRSESLSPELVAAASAVADSLPLDKQMTKSELLRQLQQHEEGSRAQKDGARPKIRLVHQIAMSVMLI